MLHELDQPTLVEVIEGPHNTLPTTTSTFPNMSPSLAHIILWKGKNWLSLGSGVTRINHI
jgi:hypothetical protein